MKDHHSGRSKLCIEREWGGPPKDFLMRNGFIVLIVVIFQKEQHAMWEGDKNNINRKKKGLARKNQTDTTLIKNKLKLTHHTKATRGGREVGETDEKSIYKKERKAGEGDVIFCLENLQTRGKANAKEGTREKERIRGKKKLHAGNYSLLYSCERGASTFAFRRRLNGGEQKTE